MNTKSIHIDHSTRSKQVDLTAQSISLIVTVCQKISVYFTRSELEIAQDDYRMKRQHQPAQQNDIINSMPLETKLGLGLYRWMD